MEHCEFRYVSYSMNYPVRCSDTIPQQLHWYSNILFSLANVQAGLQDQTTSIR